MGNSPLLVFGNSWVIQFSEFRGLYTVFGSSRAEDNLSVASNFSGIVAANKEWHIYELLFLFVGLGHSRQ